MRILALIVAFAATPVAAQTFGHPIGAAPYGSVVTTGDIHRYEMDRLRAVAEANQALADIQAIQTRQTLNALQAARRPAPPTIYASDRPLTTEPLGRPVQARGSDTADPSQAADQINAWLDRAPH